MVKSDQDSKGLARRIKDIRLNLGLSQEEFGKKIIPTATRTAVSRWESGESAPASKRLMSIAELGDTTVEYLRTGTTRTDPYSVLQSTPSSVQTSLLRLMKNREKYQDFEDPTRFAKNLTQDASELLEKIPDTIATDLRDYQDFSKKVGVASAFLTFLAIFNDCLADPGEFAQKKEDLIALLNSFFIDLEN